VVVILADNNAGAQASGRNRVMEKVSFINCVLYNFCKIELSKIRNMHTRLLATNTEEKSLER
jgi:hypothetical protein